MSRLICENMVVGPVQTNCFFLYREDDKRCIIIDPGEEAERIFQFIEKKGLKPQAILLTHGHFDHIMAAEAVKKKYEILIYAAEAEKRTLADPAVNLSVQMRQPVSMEADVWLKDGEELELLEQVVRCLMTPGHTEGGMCYYFPSAGIVFSGDTLFQESVGRTDFPTGSMSALIRSIREKLFVLPEAVQVYSGHGPKTSIQNEKMFNPFAAE